MKLLAVLISNAGTGTNLQAIIDAIENPPAGRQGKELNAKISVVISGNQDAYGLKRAKKHHLKTEICQKKEDLLKILKKYNPDYICMAGWKKIVTDDVIDAYSNRILNTHPGLIPDTLDGTVLNPDGTKAIWNKGKMTNKAIQNFLDNNSSYAGSSIHFLSDRFDFGKVLSKCFEKVKKNDDVESLYKRLKVKENKMYAEVLEKLCNESSLSS